MFKRGCLRNDLNVDNYVPNLTYVYAIITLGDFFFFSISQGISNCSQKQ